MILSILNLEQYIQRCKLQKSELQTSTIFSDFELKIPNNPEFNKLNLTKTKLEDLEKVEK